MIGKWLCRNGHHKHTDRRITGRRIRNEVSHAECLRCGEPRKDTKACMSVYGDGSLAVESCHGWMRDFPRPYRHDTPEEQEHQRKQWGIVGGLVR